MDPLVVTKVEKEGGDAPVLIIDRRGIIGTAIYQRIHKELTSVLVAQTQPEESENLIFIHYKNRIPAIPNEQYSLIIFISDNEKDLHAIAKELITKAKTDEIPYVFITPYELFTEKQAEKLHEIYQQAYTIVTGELFGEGNLFLSDIDTYIHQAATAGVIQLPFMGLRNTYPVVFDDAIQGILHTIFGSRQQHPVTYLFQKHPYTDLSLTHMLQKEDPLIHLDFIKKEKKSFFKKSTPKQHKQKEAFSSGHYFFDKEYPLTEKIIALYHQQLDPEQRKVKQYVNQTEIRPLIDLSGGREIAFLDFFGTFAKWLLFVFLLVVIFPIFLLGITVGIAGIASLNAKYALEKGEISHVQQFLSVAHGGFATADKLKTPVVFELSLLGQNGLAEQLQNTLTAGVILSQYGGDLLLAEEQLKSVINGNTLTPDTDVRESVSSAQVSLVEIQKLLSENTNPVIDRIIAPYTKGIDLLTGLFGIIPQFLGGEGKRTYLVLFQNNMELRPGGGFIGSYGLVPFDHGKLGEITIHDVYDADGQLTKHVEPPFPIRRFMGNVHLYLRDSNFDIDFPKDGQKAADMLQLETGQKVDGVIAIDLTFVKYLLSAIGSVYVPEQNVTVTADNFFLLTEQHAEKNFFPGSSQKKDFLRNVFMAIQLKLKSQQGMHMVAFFEKTLQAMMEKHLLISSTDHGIQTALTVNHVSSSLWDPRQETVGAINDFLGINEANIGVNKVNYFIERSIKQSVSIDGDGTLKGEVALIYHNTSVKNQWPGGEYRNYLRVLLPKDSVLTGISINDQKQATRSAITDPYLYETKGFTPPKELEVEKTEEEGKTLYGFLVTIPAATTESVTITYEHLEKINLGNPVLHYSLELFKQPGTNNDPYSFSFNYPLEYSLLSSSPKNQDGSSDYSLDTTLSEDKFVTVDLTKK